MKKWKKLVAGWAVLSFTVALGSTVHGIGPYTDNGLTVTDTATGLEWQQADDSTTRNWQDALAYCENLSLDGHDDWRLPNFRELDSIVDLSRYSPAIDPVFSCQSSNYWSATTYAGSASYAWDVRFYYGNGYATGKTYGHYVRCVRAGLTGSFDLSVIWAGTGNGEVNFNPPDEDCTTNCSKSYTGGTEVTLSAAPAAGSIFSSWSGGGCSGTGPCIVTMDQTVAVTATFLLDSDDDGTPDCNDGCPNDPDKTAPGYGGCGYTDETVNTGTDVTVSLSSEADITFDTISTSCDLSYSPTSDTLPSGFNLIGSVYDINSNCSFGTATVCLDYNEGELSGSENNLVLFHYNGSSWDDITGSRDTANNVICGDTTSFSPFGIGEPDSGSGGGSASTKVPVHNGLWLIPSILTGLYLLRRRKGQLA